jgi:hypothetical protein
VIAVAVQNTFRLEIYQNNIFLFLKIIFEISTLKRSKNIKKLIFNKKILFFEFFRNTD